MTTKPPTQVYAMEYKIKNLEYRAGISSMPQIVFTPDKSKYYMMLSTPLKTKRDMQMQTCIIKRKLPADPADMYGGELSQVCTDDPV